MNSTYIPYHNIPCAMEEMCYFHRHHRFPASMYTVPVYEDGTMIKLL